MKKIFFQKQWNWFASGAALGLVFLITVLLVKPIGVSTQFVIFDGIVWSWFSEDAAVKDDQAKSGFSSTNAYLNKSGGKYAKNVKNPINYSFIFVISMVLGGFLASKLESGDKNIDTQAEADNALEKLDSPTFKRHLMAFAGGVIVLIGARLAGGCTSGHMMSGMMQTSVSGYLFALGAFAAAVPVAMLIYKGGK